MSDPRLPAPADCVLRDLVDRRAAATPDRVYALFDADGSTWSYADLARWTRRFAAGFQRLGVGQGDVVLTWLPNGPHALAAWFGLNYLGAVSMPVNTAYRGALLRHVVALSGARLMVADARLAPRLAEIDTAALRQVVAIGGLPEPVAGLELLPEAALTGAGEDSDPPPRPIQPWDTLAAILTSGTTGPSKAVLCSYAQWWAAARAHTYLDADDRQMVTLPLFHVGGTSPCFNALVRGGSVAVVGAFDTRSFWDSVRRTGTTAMTVLGTMASFLASQPPSPRDRDHPLRKAVIIPLNGAALEFGRRFGVDWYSTYNMTELSCPIFTGRNPETLGTCGRPRPGTEARVVDENDCELPPGEVGELILRSDMPWALNHGYHGDPEATARAWRNGWFHTGDAFRCDAEGEFFFVDRIKDAIRRRGENVSSFEVEREVAAHPDIREAAVVPVPGEHGEDEILAVVSCVPGRSLDPAGLIEFLRPRLAHFMVPRFVRVVDGLPMTPTQKVQKHVLREQGLTADAWDREAAGIRIRRDRLDAARLG
ncbi:AMP-binding protein [Roseicella aquatilis]|uniref:ATP-dependent acyl-CoA ligase n=1 Tax=Roseicella aquatilis TaxID=2527868 RepID=A0A4R4DRA9_9PROT|nr:AMP-binding protein [Roseicella aquatilis]TCZ64799.1 ATP-dependent acyl-CoA ligase [Roseicella aquatilis]